MQSENIQKIKKLTSLFVLMAVLVVFVIYVKDNPSLIDSIKQASPVSIFIILLIYSIFLFANYLLVRLTASLFKKDIERLEMLLVTMYSTLVNFFGPLQSGPGYRALYFKSKHKVKLAEYTKVTLLYYLIFMTISVFMLFIDSYLIFPLIFTAMILLTTIYKRGAFLGYSFDFFSKITLVALLQLMLGVVLFYSELSLVGNNPSFAAAISYTGGANLAILVGITPGAIGIREAFLVLTQSLHGISNDQILAANVLDRSVYFVFLFALFLLSSSLHIKQKLSSAKSP